MALLQEGLGDIDAYVAVWVILAFYAVWPAWVPQSARSAFATHIALRDTLERLFSRCFPKCVYSQPLRSLLVRDDHSKLVVHFLVLLLIDLYCAREVSYLFSLFPLFALD